MKKLFTLSLLFMGIGALFYTGNAPMKAEAQFEPPVKPKFCAEGARIFKKFTDIEYFLQGIGEDASGEYEWIKVDLCKVYAYAPYFNITDSNGNKYLEVAGSILYVNGPKEKFLVAEKYDKVNDMMKRYID